jgi:hypothetical protein
MIGEAFFFLLVFVTLSFLLIAFLVWDGYSFTHSFSHTGNFAFTSARAFPATPSETWNSLYGLTVSARLALGLIGLAEERASRPKRMVVAENFIFFFPGKGDFVKEQEDTTRKAKGRNLRISNARKQK